MMEFSNFELSQNKFTHSNNGWVDNLICAGNTVVIIDVNKVLKKVEMLITLTQLLTYFLINEKYMRLNKLMVVKLKML